MFYRRQSILSFWVFYTVFHIVTWGVGILFTGNLLIWACFLPIARALTPTATIETDEHGKPKPQIKLFTILAKFPGFYPVMTEAHAPTASNLITAKNLCWRSPLLWPALPLFYITSILPTKYISNARLKPNNDEHKNRKA